MSLRSSPALLVLALLLVGSSALRADVTLDSLMPAEGTVGTSLELRLMGDTGKGKPKVWLTLTDDTAKKPRKTKLKVSALDDLGGGLSSLSVSFVKTKTGPGVYDMHVKPKGKGQLEQVFKAAFTMRSPTLAEVSPDSAISKQTLTITGGFFGGPAKPKVLAIPQAGGKARKLKVLQVTAGTTLEVKLPKLKTGLYSVLVSNKVGEVQLKNALTITTPGEDILTATLSSPMQPLITNQFLGVGPPSAPGSFVAAFNGSSQFGDLTIITALTLVGSQSIGISMSFSFNAGVTPTPFTVQMGDNADFFGFEMDQSQPSAHWGDGGIIPGTLTVTSATAQRITGGFSFTLVPEGDEPAAGPIQLTNGSFDVSVKPAF
jgi:hypothetical protein